jgi:hypothetical protein
LKGFSPEAGVGVQHQGGATVDAAQIEVPPPARHGWQVELGQFELLLGTFAADMVERQMIECPPTEETHAP